MPRTSQPRLIAERHAARMTALSPGASPPPVEMAIRISGRSRFQQADDLPRTRMSPELRFLEDRLSVARHLEPSAPGGLQGNGCVRKLLLQLGRQTDGPWFVRSNGAILDFDVHI